MQTVVVEYSLVRFRVDTDKLAIELSITLPHIDVTADYDVEGRVLLAPVKSSGVFRGNFSKSCFEHAVAQSVRLVPSQHTGRLPGSQSDTSSLYRHYTQSLLLSLVVIDTVLSGTCLPSFQEKVKVKFTLKRATKAQRRSRGTAPLFL